MGLIGLVVAAGAACGGEKKEPQFPPNPSATTTEEAADDSWITDDSARSDADADPIEQQPSDDATELPKPEFTDGMSVNQAISAVPSHYDYVGIDPEVLAKPLMDIETYKECKITTNDHFTVRIAIWNGKVVGADVKAATPAKTECIDRVVRALEYKEQVESINTVDYSF